MYDLQVPTSSYEKQRDILKGQLATIEDNRELVGISTKLPSIYTKSVSPRYTGNTAIAIYINTICGHRPKARRRKKRKGATL